MDVQALPVFSHGKALLSLEAFLRAKNANMSWHTIANNTTSTRSKDNGGKLFESLKALEQTRQTVDGEHTCTISLPCCFEIGDSEGFTIERKGNSQKEAIEAACLSVFAILCLKDRRRVIFRSSHWKCSLEEMLEGISRIVEVDKEVGVSLTTASQCFYPATCQPAATKLPTLPGQSSSSRSPVDEVVPGSASIHAAATPAAEVVPGPASLETAGTVCSLCIHTACDGYGKEWPHRDEVRLDIEMSNKVDADKLEHIAQTMDDTLFRTDKNGWTDTWDCLSVNREAFDYIFMNTSGGYRGFQITCKHCHSFCCMSWRKDSTEE